MPKYQAEIKTVPTGSFFKVTTEAGSASSAKEQIEHLYDPIYIHNLYECREGSMISSIGDLGGWLILGAILFVIWIIVEYWWIVIPTSAILMIVWFYKWLSD